MIHEMHLFTQGFSIEMENTASDWSQATTEIPSETVL